MEQQEQYKLIIKPGLHFIKEKQILTAI